MTGFYHTYKLARALFRMGRGAALVWAWRATRKRH